MRGMGLPCRLNDDAQAIVFIGCYGIRSKSTYPPRRLQQLPLATYNPAQNQLFEVQIMHLGRLRLRDMKLSRAEKADDAEVASERPDYPYGLSLSLDEDALEKLGIELPGIGDTFFVVAIARVRGVSEHQDEASKSQNVQLQIEQLSLDADIG